MANLTKRAVDAAMAAEKQTILWDDKLKGFGLLVLPSGTKSFIVQYRSEAGRSRRLTIGRYGAFTPDQARTEASEILLSVAKGGDPMAEKRSARAAPTVDDLLDRYIREHVKRHNGPTTQAEIERLVAKHLRLRLGALKVAAVTNGDIAKLHRAMGETPRQANHVLSIISKMFNLAEVWGMRPRNNNPVFGIKRYAEAERERFLTADELGRLGDLLGSDAEFLRDLGLTFAGEIIEAVVDDAVLKAVVFAEAIELDEETVAKVDSADPDGIEALDEALGFLEIMNGDSEIEAEVLETDLEETVVPDVPYQHRRDLADARGDLGKAELVEKMVLQGDGLDDRVHHELVSLVGVLTPGSGQPGLGHVFPPLFVELGQLREFAFKIVFLARS